MKLRIPLPKSWSKSAAEVATGGHATDGVVNGQVRASEVVEVRLPAKPDKPPNFMNEMNAVMGIGAQLLNSPHQRTATELQLRASIAETWSKRIAQKAEQSALQVAMAAIDDYNNAKMMPEWRPKDPRGRKFTGSVVNIRRPPKFTQP